MLRLLNSIWTYTPSTKVLQLLLAIPLMLFLLTVIPLYVFPPSSTTATIVDKHDITYRSGSTRNGSTYATDHQYKMDFDWSGDRAEPVNHAEALVQYSLFTRHSIGQKVSITYVRPLLFGFTAIQTIDGQWIEDYEGETVQLAMTAFIHTTWLSIPIMLILLYGLLRVTDFVHQRNLDKALNNEEIEAYIRDIAR